MKGLPILVLLMFSMVFVSGALVVEYPGEQYIKYNESFDFSTKVFNSSGQQVTSATCDVQVLQQNGQEQLNVNLPYSSPYYTKTLQAENFTEEGAYTYKIYCYTSTEGGSQDGSLIVTGNGKPLPGTNIILGFAILFLFLLSSIVLVLIKSVGHLIQRDFGIMELAYNWGLYFALLGAVVLADLYLGTLLIVDWLDKFAYWLGIPLVLLSIIAFVLSLFNAKNIEKRKAQEW